MPDTSSSLHTKTHAAHTSTIAVQTADVIVISVRPKNYMYGLQTYVHSLRWDTTAFRVFHFIVLDSSFQRLFTRFILTSIRSKKYHMVVGFWNQLFF